ncbi:response regulator [Anabaena sp. UHCC 0253]|uniref:hybrid sensor histidine kinase/response regulator n=1 Tax=Anabaena sp. UHCC 0253 TaxID=2590019 RepID=UPI0014466566|nr:response regulator [Anabaena sp. UHCC 0253]MTJ53572.1 response regulator [Anabaena sp. UHCC 0253]
MQPEQQQRILGYFLEEAREHLNTIEQGLLNLQSTLNDSEMINEVFRAAHSIKGGAAMLGLSSIQHTSHRLEDCFKILKDHPVQVDQRLESLLLDVCDTLKALIDHLGNPFGLSEEKAQALMSKTEPAMECLNEHIEKLVQAGNTGFTSPENTPVTHLQLDIPLPVQPQPSPVTIRQNQDWTEFQSQVLQILREMLQLFKQTGLSSSRDNLQNCCRQLVQIGRNLNLSNWCNLCESAGLAISNPNNSYLTLAKIVITEIKQAQELVLQNRAAEITISQQLETLFALPELEFLEFEETEPDLEPATPVNVINTHGFTDKPLLNHDHPVILNDNNIAHNGPEVGISELNTLADLFEGDTPDLDDNWQQVEILDDINNYQLSINDSETDNNNYDLDDLLFFADAEQHEVTPQNAEDLNFLFDDNLLEIDNTDSATPLELVDTPSVVQNNLLETETELKFPSDEVLTELIAISRESRQHDEITQLTNINADEQLEELSLTIAEPETPTEISNESATSFDSLFSSQSSINEDANLLAEITPTPAKKSATKPSTPESLSLDNLFTEVEENTPLLTNEFDDLFGTEETITNISNSINDLDNFWGDVDISQPETTTPVNQDIAKELEESLFTASVEKVTNSQPASNNSLGGEDFDLIFQEQEQSLDLFFTTDDDSDRPAAVDNLFGDVVDATANHLPIIESREVAESGINGFSQAPEELDSIPEFTQQPLLFETGEENSNENLSLFAEEITFTPENLVDNDVSATLTEEETGLDFGAAFADFELESESNLSPETPELATTELDEFAEIETLLEQPELDEFAEIETLLEQPELDGFAEIETLLEQPELDEFAEIEALLEQPEENANQVSIQDEDFAALEALLGENAEPSTVPQVFQQPPIINQPATTSISRLEDEFSELEDLLAQADQTMSSTLATSAKTSSSKIPRPTTRRTLREETMKIPVKQLDDMSNLVGELVVNRNTLEQDHERLRQSLDNLLVQVQHLSDVGARMQEYYERSLLEASLLASRRSRDNSSSSGNSHDRGFSEIEMDRFTPFHILAQEMIEFIVRVRESASDIDFVTEETEQVARQLRQATGQLQEGLTKARMVPFTQAIDRLRRGVRDNAIKYGKQVDLVTEGLDTLIDKMILDHLTDPLTHMVNNAIAHGIETPAVRQAAGKSPTGIISIRALQQGNQTVISVSDDGAGIDHEKVKNKAIKKGIITPEQAKTMTRPDIYELLFLPSFSTADEVDDIKGRGVGMNVVQNDISEIRGTVGTDSILGKGTSFTIRLPLTLSICKALFCISDRTRIAFPMDGVEDTLDIPARNVQKDANGQSFIVWRDTMLPYKPLKDILVFNRQLTRGNVYGANRDDDMVSVVVVRSGSTMIALQIDQVLSEQEIVIKQFEGPAPKPSGVAGATVLGDGMIMPIADVLEIVDIFQGKMSKNIVGNWQQPRSPALDLPTVEKVETTVLIVDDSITVRELLSLTFNKAGYRVEQARDGQEAWDKLRSGLPCDIVFCDIEMPRCDGLELLSRIQKDNTLNHLPIAMLTSRGADKHRQMAVQLGASGYFTKPYLEEALLEAASRMLKGEKLLSI